MEQIDKVHIYVSGRVQGVMFRVAAQKKARELELMGWAKNMPSGQVEIVAEGEKPKLNLFIDWCRVGPPLAQVEDFRYERGGPLEGLDDFTIQ